MPCREITWPKKKFASNTPAYFAHLATHEHTACYQWTVERQTVCTMDIIVLEASQAPIRSVIVSTCSNNGHVMKLLLSWSLLETHCMQHTPRTRKRTLNTYEVLLICTCSCLCCWLRFATVSCTCSIWNLCFGCDSILLRLRVHAGMADLARVRAHGCVCVLSAWWCAHAVMIITSSLVAFIMMIVLLNRDHFFCFCRSLFFQSLDSSLVGIWHLCNFVCILCLQEENEKFWERQ